MLLSAAALLGLVVNAQLVAAMPRVPLPVPDAGAVKVAVHQNLVPAGRLVGAELRLELDVVEGAWKAEGEADPEVPILAFAERGKPPLVPGPLVRVPIGTSMRVLLRNRTDSALVIGGLRPGTPEDADTVHLAPGAAREVRATLSAAGTFLYWGAFLGTTLGDRLWKDSQLHGAIVVDVPGAQLPDRVLVLSEWFHPYDEGRAWQVVTVINGKGWPHSETIDMQQGDSARFRVINATALHHPLHLHGFFYQIDARGRVGLDSPVPEAERHLSNTDVIAPFRTVSFRFLASTPGNWLFHCHLAFHADENASLATVPHEGHASAGSAPHSMRGLVIGLKVAPKPDYVEAPAADARELRLFVQQKPRALQAGATAFSFVLQNGPEAPARDSIVLPGSVLELLRNEPVRIVVRNNLDEPTAIHWHGLEIESYPDGVPNFSGLGSRIFTQIAPADSFVAEFTPPRAGTYPYHSHLNDRKQISSGMYGALLVLDRPRDLARDHLIVAGGGGPEVEAHYESPYALVNGRTFPPALRLAVGETHRLRIVSLHPDWRVAFTLRNDASIARWRAIATDGADLPAAIATERPAHLEMGPGQTADFEFTPTEPGRWRLEVKSVEPGWHIPLPVIVEAKKAK